MNGMQANLKGLTFLVVDDEPDNVGVIVKLLSLMGASVHSAEDGEQGLEAARRFRPDFILTDLSMPVMSGWQMLHEARKDPAIEGIPIIALTAHAMAGDRERVLQAGFVSYIAKPIDVPLFLPQLTNIVRGFGPKSRPVMEQPGGNGTAAKQVRPDEPKSVLHPDASKPPEMRADGSKSREVNL